MGSKSHKITIRILTNIFLGILNEEFLSEQDLNKMSTQESFDLQGQCVLATGDSVKSPGAKWICVWMKKLVLDSIWLKDTDWVANLLSHLPSRIFAKSLLRKNGFKVPVNKLNFVKNSWSLSSPNLRSVVMSRQNHHLCRTFHSLSFSTILLDASSKSISGTNLAGSPIKSLQGYQVDRKSHGDENLSH